jgi:serine/threonine protein phosphatase PrpC
LISQALYGGFNEVDAECRRRFKTSGTTATLAVQVGWELIVANVGDSLAFLDTGAEILQVRSC